MADIARHVRIFEANPSDDFVTKREAAISEVAKGLLKSRAPADVVAIANSLVVAATFKDVPGSFGTVVAAALKKVAPSFVVDQHSNELATCSLLAGLLGLENAAASTGSVTAWDYFAAALWTGLSFQPPGSDARREQLRQELLTAAQRFALASAESARRRVAVEAVPQLKEEPANTTDVTRALRAAVSALKGNALVDREEIDFLWWSIGGWCKLLDVRYADADVYAGGMAAGLEAAQRMRRMPMDAHKELVLRRVGHGDDKTLSALLKGLGDNRAKLAVAYSALPIVSANPEVFPLLTALGDGATKGSKGSSPLKDWATRAFLEATTVVVLQQPEV